MSEERVVSDLVWTPEQGLATPEVRGISWENFLLSDDKYLGKWRTDSGIRVTPETALQSTIVLACCRILAETVSGLPIHVYRRSPDGGDEIAKEIPLYKVLTFRPNDWQTKQEFFEQIVMTIALWGNSYTRIRSGQYGSVSQLDNLHPSRMEVERLENGRLRYSYTDPETGRLERYNQDQIMHCRWTPEQDGIKGMVPVEIAREAIGLARACEQHAARFWANSARPGVVLQTEGTLNAEAAERLRDNWERLHRGSERAFRTAVLTGGMKAVELGMTNESSQFVASRDFQTAEICRVYRIPQHLIQGTPGGDLEVQGQEFVTYTLMPWLNRIESSISRSLIYNDDEYYAKFDVRGLLRANSQQRASYYSTMTSLGIMTINDCRRAEGLKPLGDLGDHHFVAMNTQTLEEATKPKPEGGMPGMPGGGGGGGPPPPAPGGPPSLPEVKTGKAPIESPKGEASTPKEEEAVEEASADWEDALEARAFCATGEGQGTDNSCSSSGGTATATANVDNSWKKSFREYTYTPGDGDSPVKGGDDIKSLSIEGGVATKSAKESKFPVADSMPQSVSVEQANESMKEYVDFRPSIGTNNSVFAVPPSEEDLTRAILISNKDKVSKIGKAGELPEGTPVAIRIDIPAFNESTKQMGKSVYAVTVHESKGGKGFGSPIGYETMARLSGSIVFASKETEAIRVATGESTKTPLATVKGAFDPSREIPKDIDSWTPVGFDPKKAAYFYDKKTGQEVVGGTDSLSVGNTVFTRQPQYGSRNAKTHYRSADEMFATGSWGLESRAFCPTGEGNGTDNSCGSKQGGGAASIDYDKLIDRIASSPDGFTLDVRNVEQPEDGIMVSEFQNDSVRSMRINAATIRAASSAIKVREFINNNSDLLLGRSDRFLGGWLDGDDFYFDVATRFEPKDAEKALETGRESGQLAVFNLATFNTTYVHYEPEDSRKPKDWDERFDRAKSDLGDQGQELEKHGKKTVRSVAFSESQDYSCLDKETTSEQQHSEGRHSGEGVEASSVSSVSPMGGEGGFGAGGDSRSGVVQGQSGGGSGTVRGQVEFRDGIGDDCGRGPGSIFGPGNKCQDEGSGLSPAMGGGGSGTGWKKLDTPSEYDSERLKVDPPCRSLAEVNTATIFNGRTLSASLKEVGVTLDQAAKVCGNLSPESNVVVAHGNLKDIVNWIDNPSRATDPESSVTVVSKQPFGGVEDAIATAATLSRTDDDELLLSYVMFSVAPEAQRDNPIAVARGLYSGVVKSINEAEKAGVEEVGMLAAGSDSNDEFKGYRIWPRLGFDGIIPRNRVTPTYSIRLGFFEKYGSNLPDTILSDRAKQEKSEGALTIQSLYDTKEGQRWWEENGGPMAMFLRIGDNEDTGWQRYQKISSKVTNRDIIDVLDVEWRAIHGEAEQRGFCPTGEGNGIDNSCGGQMMAPDKDGGGSSVARPSAGAGKPSSVTVESQESLDKAASVLGLGGVDDVVKISGGNVRGAKVDVYADPSGFTKVSSLWPIDREDPDGGGKVFTEVSMASTPEGKVLGFEAFGPSGGSISSGADQQRVMSIISEKVAESIESAEENGFVAVTTFAVGDANNQYKGYRLWPQFGFDADLPRDLAKRVPPEIVLKSKGIDIPPPGSTSIPHHLVVKSLASQNRDLTIQELISTREGKRWWDENGDDISLKLDLTDKSSLGYKKWQGMKDRLPALRERNETRSFFDAFVESRDADCGRTPDGKFGSDNKCQEDGDGAATATASGGALGKARNVDVMIDGGKATAVIDDEARTRALEDTASHPRPDGLSSGSTADLWSRTFVERNGSTKTKITATDPVFPQDRLAMNGTYVAHESVGQYLSMRHEDDRAAAGGVGPGAIIDTTQLLPQPQFTYVSEAISDDVMHAYESGRFDPGFYSKDLEDAMTKMSSRHPELATDENGRFVFTMLTAILSNGQDPTANIADSDGVYDMYKQHGTCMPEGSIAGTRSAAAKTSLALFQSMIDSFGVERTKNLLSGYTTAENVNKTFAKLSAKSSNSEWRERTDSQPWMTDHYKAKDKKTGEALATTNLVKTDSSGEFKDEVVPMASVFGPKIGSFFANLNGRHDFLTMDRWLMRSVGRVTGELLTRSTPQGAKTRAEDAIKALDVEKWKPSVYMFGVDKQFGVTKQDLLRSLKIQKKTGVIEENGAAYLWAIAAERSHKNTTKPNGGGYGKDPDADKHACHVSGNGLFKSLIHEQQDPRGAQARRSIREVFRSVVKDIEAKYPDRKGKVDVDEVQAILWQYEKNLWKHLGAKVQIDENSLYSKAADDLLTGKTKERKFKPESRAALLEALRDIGDSNDDWQFQAEQESWDSDIGESGIDFNELFLELERLTSEEKAPSALESAKNTVNDLRAVGLTTVEMPKAGLDGLHVMGFDAEIPPDLAEKLPESLSHCQTLLDLHVSSEGQAWWEENGRDIDVSIDLDGVQGQIFDSFIAGKRWEDIIEEGILDDYGNS